MVVKLLLFLQLLLNQIGLTEIDNEINSNKQLIQELNIEIADAREKGIAETMDIVEKIGYVRNLEEEVTELEAKKDKFEKQQYLK